LLLYSSAADRGGRITVKMPNFWDLYKIIRTLFIGVCERCRTSLELFESAGNFPGQFASANRFAVCTQQKQFQI
jgi:hypothetical protein